MYADSNEFFLVFTTYQRLLKMFFMFGSLLPGAGSRVYMAVVHVVIKEDTL